MFDKLKKLKDVARLNNILAKEKETVEDEGIRLTLNGKLEIEEIKLNPDLGVEKEEEVLKRVFNQAIKKIQLNVARKMSHMGS